LDSYKLTFQEQLDHENNQAKDEHEDADTVNTMHILHEVCFWPVWIRFLNVEVFGKLLKYTHKKKLHHKDTVSNKVVTYRSVMVRGFFSPYPAS